MTRSRGGLWNGELDGLVGRDEALGRLRATLDEGGRVAVVLGIAGAGKTSLLDVACRAAAAEGARVVRITGYASDQYLAYAALTDLLAKAEALPPGPDWTARDPLRLRLDVLARLEEAAEDSPLLLSVDDAQWIDPSSLSVLGFLANRLAPSGVSLVVAARGESPPSGWDRHPRVLLEALDGRQSAVLLRRAGLVLSPFIRSAVLERAGGNPLALLQLGQAAASQPQAVGQLLDGGTLSDVELSFVRLLPDLPPATRHILLLAAAGATDLRVLGRTTDPGRLLADLAPGETAGLVRVTGHRLNFRHPLARSAVYGSATASDRAAAHRRLAEAYVDDLERQVWHRAEATILPDEDTARALVAVADRARGRGAIGEAARTLARAAELTEDPHLRELRMLDALEFATPTGHFDWLISNATRLRDSTADPAVRAQTTHHIAYALAQTWQQRLARQTLVDALEQLVTLDTFLGWGSLTTLAALTYQTGEDPALVAHWLRRYEREAPPASESLAPLTQAAKAWIRATMDPLGHRPDLIALVRDAPSPEATDPPDLVAEREMLLASAAWLIEEPRTALVRYGRVLEVMSRVSPARQYLQALSGMGQVQLDSALFDDADETGRLLCDVAEAENLGYTNMLGGQLRARVAAIRGDVATATRLLDEMLVNIDVGQNLALEATVRVGLAHARFSENDMPGAYEQFRSLFHADGQPLHVHVSYHYLGDLVSVAARAGRLDDARPVVAAAIRRIPHPRSVRHELILARAEAILTDDDGAARHFMAATSPTEAAQWPFDLANARLEYGSWLRRNTNPTAARTQLAAALETFVRVGARAWADLARAELRAAGVPAMIEEGPATAWARLTAQERQVVKLAAVGMTNPQIGRLLFLSPRTVGAHLYHAFPKLGVTSRSQLRDIVAQDPTV